MERKVLGASQVLQALGAWLAPAGIVPAIMTLRFIPSVYNVQAAHMMLRGVFTSTVPLSVYRGPGRTEANCYSAETGELAPIRPRS